MSVLLPGTSAASYLTCANDITFGGTTTLSVHCLLYPTLLGATVNQSIFQKRLNGVSDFPFNFRIAKFNAGANGEVPNLLFTGTDGTGNIVHYNYDTGGTGLQIRSDLPTVVVNTWIAAGIRFDFGGADTADMFTNGVKYTIAPGEIDGIAAASNPAINPRWGGSNVANTNFTGRLAHMAVWNRLLTDAEFALLGGLTYPGRYRHPRALPNPTGLLGYWRGNESATPTLDQSGNANSLTWTGAASLAADPLGIDELLPHGRERSRARYR